MTRTTWLFLRHGQSTANAEGWLAGHRDAPLTPRGQEQARAAAEVLRQVPLVTVHTSDLERARRTAEAVLENRAIPLRVTPALRERTCGDWEGRAIAGLDPDRDMRRFLSWNGRPPGGESLRDVAERAIGYLATCEADGPTLVVAHGALLRAILGVLDGSPPDAIGRWQPENCEVYTRTMEPGTWARLLRSLPD